MHFRSTQVAVLLGTGLLVLLTPQLTAAYAQELQLSLDPTVSDVTTDPKLTGDDVANAVNADFMARQGEKLVLSGRSGDRQFRFFAARAASSGSFQGGAVLRANGAISGRWSAEFQCRDPRVTAESTDPDPIRKVLVAVALARAKQVLCP